ncbi:MAG: 4Fe-4S dicluster domain-containing protein [Candidatus Cloacimonadota bacterium]|nr:4Fe-4S dicluster domain-containing protein [Candidatus Cloacimonadota bacterium]
MKKLLIDLPKIIKDPQALEKIDCGYLYHEGANRGVFSLIELAEFGVYCRQCKDAFCVAACPKDALERTETNLIKRYNMRCVGCNSCALACPFGTIFPETINYLTAKCDYCLNQITEDPNYKPLCVLTAENDGIQIADLEEENPAENLFFVGEHIAVRTKSWRAKENKLEK